MIEPILRERGTRFIFFSALEHLESNDYRNPCFFASKCGT